MSAGSKCQWVKVSEGSKCPWGQSVGGVKVSLGSKCQQGQIVFGVNLGMSHINDLLNTPDSSNFVLCLQITVIEFVNKGQNWKDREVVHIGKHFRYS